MKTRWFRVLLALVAVAAAGCAPTFQSNRAELDLRAQKLRNVVLLPPDTKICELSAGGVKEQRDDWCTVGRKNLEKAIIENLGARGISVRLFQVPADLANEVDEIKALYQAVKDSMYTHAYYWNGQNPNFFPDRLKDFDYTVGSLEKLLKKQKADGLLLIQAEDEVSSSGRKALRVVQAINPFGTAGRSGMTQAVIALADRKGDILWNNFFYESGGYDLREPDSTRSFVKELMTGFPVEGK
jgi:hypothetical protein